MATHLPIHQPVVDSIPLPLTLTCLQLLVGGFIRFIELPTGDVLVVNESAAEFAAINPSASSLAGPAGPIYGDAVLCSPTEIA